MKYFGTVKSFDTDKGHGEIKPETGGDALRFESAAISWGKINPPTVASACHMTWAPTTSVSRARSTSRLSNATL